MTMRHDVLALLLDSWDRNNTILTNLLLALPAGSLTQRPLPDSPSIARLFTHMHAVRMHLVAEAASEFAQPLAEDGWRGEQDQARIAALLDQSALAVRAAVEGRLRTGQDMDLMYDHPVLLLQHLLWHEGYYHGQIKLTLKVLGQALDDEEIGPVTWDIWMKKMSRATSDL